MSSTPLVPLVIEFIGRAQEPRSEGPSRRTPIVGPPMLRVFVTRRSDAVTVEVHDVDGLSLVAQALEVARQFDPLSLMIEGPFVTFAVNPPVWFGRIRPVEPLDTIETVLVGAAAAAASRLRSVGLDPA